MRSAHIAPIHGRRSTTGRDEASPAASRFMLFVGAGTIGLGLDILIGYALAIWLG